MKLALIAITLATLLLGACASTDEDTRAEITALRVEVAALVERMDATNPEIEALAERFDALSADVDALVATVDLLASDASSRVDVATTAIVVNKRVILAETSVLSGPNGTTGSIGYSVPYCVTYVIAGVTDETCAEAFFLYDAQATGPLVAQGKHVLDCWNNRTRIADPLPDCWS